MKNLEKTILNNLITNNEYARKVLPFLKSDYFQDKNEQIIFEEIQKFSIKYSKLPTSTSLQVELDNRKDLNEQQFKDITSIVDSFHSEEVDGQWLLE